VLKASLGSGKLLPRTRLSPESPPRHESAAVTLQKVYRSFRTRRRLADCAVLVEQSWCARLLLPCLFGLALPDFFHPHCAFRSMHIWRERERDAADPRSRRVRLLPGGSCWISRCSSAAPSPSSTSRSRSPPCPGGRGPGPGPPRSGRGSPRTRRHRSSRCSIGSKR
jgi:hypothetical protein